jgi:hypothetical protein
MNISSVCESIIPFASKYIYLFLSDLVLLVLHFVAQFIFSDSRTSSLLVLETVIGKKYKLNISCLLNKYSCYK